MSSTRYDGTFLLTQCATLLHCATKDAEKSASFLTYGRQLHTLICTKDLTLWYRPFQESILTSRPLQIIAFSDAGFVPLGKMCSLESGLLLIGLPLARNGPIECAGHVIWWVGGNLRRVARSPLACESASLVTVADSAVWYRAVLMEFWFGVFDYAPIR